MIVRTLISSSVSKLIIRVAGFSLLALGLFICSGIAVTALSALSVRAFTASSTDFIINQDLNQGGGGLPSYSMSSSTDYKAVALSGGTALGTSTATDFSVRSGFLISYNTTSLTFVVDASSKDLGTLTQGGMSPATTTISVSTSNTSGFNVQASHSGTATLALVGNSAVTIPDKTAWVPGGSCTTAGNSTASTTQPYTLQFRVQNSATDAADYCSSWWGSDDTTANALFAGFPSTSQQIINRSTSSVSTTTATVLYELGVPSTQPSGTYTGTVSYIAVANP
jgi:hypothetical protein